MQSCLFRFLPPIKPSLEIGSITILDSVFELGLEWEYKDRYPATSGNINRENNNGLFFDELSKGARYGTALAGKVIDIVVTQWFFLFEKGRLATMGYGSA